MPTGEQFELAAAGYRAVVTECGATLRVLEHAGRPLLHGFGEDEMSSAGRGQLLMPWPNRIRDGAYTFDGDDHRLGLSEPTQGHAIHGLVRWAAWSREEHGATSVSLSLPADGAERLPVDGRPARDLRPVGRRADRDPDRDEPQRPARAVRLGCAPVPERRAGPVDGWELTLPASRRLLADERQIPVGEEEVSDTAYDFRVARPLRDLRLDDGFGELERDGSGVATAVVRDPATGLGAALWVDRHHPWLMVFSADAGWDPPRQALAVEPMTAPPDAFRSGRDLLTLAPAGDAGDEVSVSWGIRTLE